MIDGQIPAAGIGNFYQLGRRSAQIRATRVNHLIGGTISEIVRRKGWTVTEDDLQSIVDELARRLERSVAIDDPGIRLLAASRHFGDEDSIRVSSVLNREVPPGVADFMLAQGIARWTTPSVVNMSGVRDALPRLCAPVLCNGLLLGYLWLIDKDGMFGEDEFAASAQAAERAGIVLYRRLLTHQRSTARREAILRELVSPDAMIRGQAIEDLHGEQLFPDVPIHFTVLAVCPRVPSATSGPQGVALEVAVEDGVQAIQDDVALMAASHTRAWILLVQRKAPSQLLADTVTTRIATRFKRLTNSDSALVFGVGTTVERLDDVTDSYRQAFVAARAALLVPGLGEVARWGELGPYGLLLKLSAQELSEASQVPAISALEGSGLASRSTRHTRVVLRQRRQCGSDRRGAEYSSRHVVSANQADRAGHRPKPRKRGRPPDVAPRLEAASTERCRP